VRENKVGAVWYATVVVDSQSYLREQVTGWFATCVP
jgi:hypothetical protein